MTSVAGHILHLHENLDLTFGELFEILELAFNGKLEHVAEKVDGINLMFSWNSSDGVRAARSAQDLKSGGMSADDLIARYEGRGNVQRAFSDGFDVLTRAISCLPEHELLKIFGQHFTRWYSIEIVHSQFTNVMNYDGDYIVFHTYPILEINGGFVRKIVNDVYAKKLLTSINAMQNAIKARSWRVASSGVSSMMAMVDGTALESARTSIMGAMAKAGVTLDNTLRDYVANMAVLDLETFKVPMQIKQKISDRIAKRSGAPNLVALKKMINVGLRDDLDSFVKREVELRKVWMEPIEAAVRGFAVSLLMNFRSSFVGNHGRSIERLRDRLNDAIKCVRTNGDTTAIARLESELKNLPNTSSLSTAEGIVFKYKDTTYKLTGAFAPLHRILSLVKGLNQGVSVDDDTNNG